MPSNDVRTLLEDREGSLWVGSYGGGLLRLRDGKFTSFGLSEGLLGNLAWTITPWPVEQDAWVGTDAGLSHYVDGKFDYLSPRLDLKTSGYARCSRIAVAPYGSALRSRGAYRYQDGKLTEYSERTGLSGNLVKAIIEDSQGRIVMATDKSVDIIENGKRLPTPAAIVQLGAITTSVLHEDAQHRLWIGTDAHALYMFANGAVSAYTPADGLPGSRVLSIHDDGHGGLLLGTTGGLGRIRDGKAISARSGYRPADRDGDSESCEIAMTPTG